MRVSMTNVGTPDAIHTIYESIAQAEDRERLARLANEGELRAKIAELKDELEKLRAEIQRLQITQVHHYHYPTWPQTWPSVVPTIPYKIVWDTATGTTTSGGPNT